MNDTIEIIDYDPQYKSDFATLNYRWIKAYFKVEGTDRQYLDNPEEMILHKGGEILFVKLNGEVIGTCALVKVDAHRFELAKMAIQPGIQGRGIGYQLGLAIIKKAKAYGAKVLFLESNTILEPAIKLYRKLGFKEVEGYTSPYERSNIQMELMLD
jgi:N-acetylglutamate synthase-like GNAT family acetyltransferase